MKIIKIITGLGCGGAEYQAVNLAERLQQRGHQLAIISLTGSSHVRPKSESIKVYEINMRKTPLGLLTALLQCRDIINSFKPDVVHSHMVHANIFARLLRPISRIPRLICTAHNTNEGGRIRMILYRITDRLCDLTTNVSQEAVARFISLKAAPERRITHVYNGIDTEKFTFDGSARDEIRRLNSINGPLLLAVGRLTEAKDYPNLLNAMVLVKREIPDVKLWIAGDGHLKEYLISLTTKLNLNENVKFLGICDNVNKLMSAADIFVLSSAWEGFGLVVAEALACERQVVATDCGGVKEVLGGNGHLVQPKSHEQLAEAITLALKKPITLNTSGRQRVECQFSFSNLVPIWETVYIKRT